ncbi:MAG: DNA repair protein RecO [Firmicutes bacterium]|nr:DNA repair protein RecO [Bacillota bacterium]
MACYRSEAIVLRTWDLGEADKALTLYTKDEGKIRAAGRGARRMRSRLLAVCQPFVHGRYLFFRGKGMDTIAQGELINSYRGLREELDRMAAAAYLAELVDVLVEERDPQEELFRLLSDSFDFMVEHGPTALLLRFFELQLMNLLGYRPRLADCAVCGTQQYVDPRFSAAKGGLLCGTCAGEDPAALKISPGAWESLRCLLAGRMTLVGRLRPSPAVAAELEAVLRGYVDYRLARPLKSLEFLQTLQR